MYDARTASGQGGDADGGWYFCLRGEALDVWCMSAPSILHWKGVLVDGLPRNLALGRITQCPTDNLPALAACVESKIAAFAAALERRS